jgi:hypothetical protein
MWLGQQRVKSIARSVTRMGHDNLQLTCQIIICVEELDKVVIFISNDIMILERTKVLSSKFTVKDFKYGAYNRLQAPNHNLGGYSHRER